MVDILEYIDKYGPWTADCVEYAPGKRTHPGKSPQWLTNRSETYAFLFEQAIRKPIHQCRILDIGALEGGISYHLARLGADVTGIEIRDDNLGRCGFLKEVCPELPMRFMKEDMFAISKEKYGEFDGILLAGTLYHVDAPQILPLLQTLREMTDTLIVDSHISTKLLEKYVVPNKELCLYGRSVREHSPEDDFSLRDKRFWSSYSNDYSFWMTENSLVNALNKAGFRYVTKPLHPTVHWYWKDRSVWLACAGYGSIRPQIDLLPEPDPRVTEHEQLVYQSSQPHNPSTQYI